MEQPYLVVTVTLSLYDYVRLDLQTAQHLLHYLADHGIDLSREITWWNDPASLHRVSASVSAPQGVSIKEATMITLTSLLLLCGILALGLFFAGCCDEGDEDA